MNIIDSYPMFPGKCYLHGGNDTPVIDTMLSLDPIDGADFAGRLYICHFCAVEMGSAFGMVSRETHDGALAEANDATNVANARVKSLETKMAKLQRERDRATTTVDEIFSKGVRQTGRGSSREYLIEAKG